MSATQAMKLIEGPQRRGAELTLAIAICFILALLVLPLPGVMLDMFLALSIGLSLVVLLVAIHTTNPLEFSAFPAVLLLLTLFRLALNVSSTRLILGEGHAGKMIEAFGQFVVGGNYAVGVVLFIILIIINFMVITKGSGRVAEVAARFTLDAMPGKQMAIDADLSAGLIDETEAKRRREEISRTADFFGAMDGASKFVKGDAVAGLIITGINIIGGIFIGAVQRGMPVADALSHYTILTVGDGLVSQIPALIVSTAAGLMVTYSSGGTRMGSALAKQLGSHPRAMWITSGALISFGLVPGLPTLPFMVLGGGAAFLARSAAAQERTQLQLAAAAAEVSDLPVAEEDPMQDLLQVDPIELDVGYALIPLIDEGQGGDLLERISMLRKQAALELGILIPPIRIRDDIRLPANEYVVKLRGTEIARGEIMPRFLMALDTGNVLEQIDGMETVDPSFGMPARWIAPSRRLEAESFGYVVVEPTTVVATFLMEILKGHAGELLGRQDVQEMMDTLKRSHPALVDEVVPRLTLGTLHRVLQRLLRERVPIRDLVTILEALGDASEQSKDPEILAEHVRRSMGNVIARTYMDETGSIRGFTVGARLEAALTGLFSPRPGQGASTALLDPDAMTNLLRDLNTLALAHQSDGRPLPLIAPPALRIGIRRLIEPVLPQLPVVSLAELPPHVGLHSVGTWDLES